MRRFQKGDRVVALKDIEILNSAVKGHSYVVLDIAEHSVDRPSVQIKEHAPFIYEWCFELESVYNSPLMKAMR